jgi:3'-phosphoadenosine 5'-phosphosulfate sulfotransferase (PAPS reductase)/FAD synthetase
MTGLDLDAIGTEVRKQLALFDGDVPAEINLHDYDLIIINSSAGKDSMCCLRHVYLLAIKQGYPLNRIVVQYNSLGDRVVWPATGLIGPNAEPLVKAFGFRPGTKVLAAYQAAHYGLRFVVTRNPKPGDLLDHIADHGRFPDGGRRFCTSAEKRGPGKALITAEHRELGIQGRPARILYAFGFRADESSGRAKKAQKFTRPELFLREGADANGVRVVDEWSPIFRWSDEEVWADIKASGVPYHWAYDAGMNRLSCSFCVLAGGDDLILAAALRPDVALQYLAVERANQALGRAAADAGEQYPLAGRIFQSKVNKSGLETGRSMASIVAAARNHPIIARLGLRTDLFDLAA